MPSIQRRHKRQRREYHDGHLLQLSVGWDFFNNAWGDIASCPNWPSKEALQDMELCWEQHGEQVLAEQESMVPSFGELMFDRGMEAREAMEAIRDAVDERWPTQNPS